MLYSWGRKESDTTERLNWTESYVVFQLLSHVRLFVTPWTATHRASLSLTVSQSLIKLTSVDSVKPSNHLILCLPLLLLPSIFPSIRVFSNESALGIKWPKYWNFSFSISPSNEYSAWFPLGLTGLISLLSKGLSRVFSSTTVQNHHFFSPLSLWSNYHIRTWLLEKSQIWWYGPLLAEWCRCSSNMLYRFVIAFLPRSKCLLISWLQSPPAVTLEPKKRKFVIASIVSPSICHEVMGPDAMNLVFQSWVLTQLFTFFFHLHQEAVCGSSLLSAIRMVPSYIWGYWYFSKQACASSSPAFRMMYSECKLNQRGDNIQHWHTPFSILIQSFVPRPLLHVASWSADTFPRRQVRWSDTFISLRIFHSLLWSTKSKALA